MTPLLAVLFLAFVGLGSHHRKVTTVSSEAQRYFDQGLMFLYVLS